MSDFSGRNDFYTTIFSTITDLLLPNLDKPEISIIKQQKSNKSQFQISKF